MDQEVGSPENFNKAVYKIRTECSEQIHKAGLINEDCLKNTEGKDKKNEEKKRIKFTDNDVEMSPESNQDNTKNVSAFRRVTRSQRFELSMNRRQNNSRWRQIILASPANKSQSKKKYLNNESNSTQNGNIEEIKKYKNERLNL